LINTLDPAKLLDLINSPVLARFVWTGLFFVLAGTGTFRFHWLQFCTLGKIRFLAVFLAVFLADVPQGEKLIVGQGNDLGTMRSEPF